MKFKWIDGLPFVSAALTVENQQLQFNNVLIDTGAASSVFCTDKLFEFGLGLQPTDIVLEMAGIGGSERVFQRTVNSIQFGEILVNNPTVQFGEMDYGFDIDGIIGVDILVAAPVLIDFLKDEILISN